GSLRCACERPLNTGLLPVGEISDISVTSVHRPFRLRTLVVTATGVHSVTVGHSVSAFRGVLPRNLQRLFRFPLVRFVAPSLANRTTTSFGERWLLASLVLMQLTAARISCSLSVPSILCTALVIVTVMLSDAFAFAVMRPTTWLLKSPSRSAGISLIRS